MNWLFSLLFPKTDTTVRIRRDHLPGLKAPTVAPWIPTKPDQEKQQASAIREAYKRYKAANPKPPEKRMRNDEGLGL
jgi:hypothetical protein